jgi:hypothetical protein
MRSSGPQPGVAWRTLAAPLVGTVNVAGTEGDGVITLILGLLLAIIGGVAVARGMKLVGIVASFVAVAVMFLVTVLAFQSAVEVITEINEDGFARASIGIGLWILALGIAGSRVGTIGLLLNREE